MERLTPRSIGPGSTRFRRAGDRQGPGHGWRVLRCRVDLIGWPTYAAANLLLGFTYGLIGALLAPLFGRVGGVFVAFLLPFLDIGIVQSPMLHPEPTSLSKLLPGYGGSRVLLDGALTHGFDETVPLLISLAWLAALVIVVALTYLHLTKPARLPEMTPR